MTASEDPLAFDITEWVFSTGEALKLTAVTRQQIDYWGRTRILPDHLAWGHGSGNHLRWRFVDLVATDLIASLSGACGLDSSLFRDREFHVNLAVAHAMYGWDLAVVIDQTGPSITPAFDLVCELHRRDANLATIAMVGPLAESIARNARSLRAEATL